MDDRLSKDERKRQRQLERLANQNSGNSSDSMKWIILSIAAIVFIAFFGTVIYLVKQQQNKPVVLSAAGYSKGSGDVTVVEFGDLQCPACKAYEPMVQQLSKDFKGKMKLVYKHFPLTSVHPNAMLAAKVAVAAGNQDKFWEMHDWLYDNQDSWSSLSGNEAREKMNAAAEKLKLDIEKFKKDVDSSETAQKITENQNEGIEAGVAGTPTFFIDNVRIETPPDYDSFKKIVQDAINSKK